MFRDTLYGNFVQIAKVLILFNKLKSERNSILTVQKGRPHFGNGRTMRIDCFLKNHESKRRLTKECRNNVKDL